MIKEIKYSFFTLVIILFLLFTNKYYFSDENKKKSFRSFNEIDNRISAYSKKLPILENDTKNIIEYIDQSNDKKKKKFNFWKLLKPNE